MQHTVKLEQQMAEEAQRQHLLVCTGGNIYMQVWERGCKEGRTTGTWKRGNSTVFDTEGERL